jgi:hypothetical protein
MDYQCWHVPQSRAAKAWNARVTMSANMPHNVERLLTRADLRIEPMISLSKTSIPSHNGPVLYSAEQRLCAESSAGISNSPSVFATTSRAHAVAGVTQSADRVTS